MTETRSETHAEIRIERTIAASPERVYAAWTDPALMNRWFCPNPAMALDVTADVVVGGTYRVDMGEGRHVAEGTYTELVPPRVVAFTWRWTTADDPVTQVRVELEPTATGTHLVLVQTGLADLEDAKGHREGWELSLDRLPAVL
jgi:uncharacterized protein YndB with AHSA1/START domain